MVKRLAHWYMGMAVLGGGLLALSGLWTDPWLWTYLGVWGALGTYAMVALDDDLLRERFKPPSPGADRVPLAFIRLIALSHLVVAALDAGRWQLATVPSPLRVVSIVGMAMAFVLMFRAMRANRFFSSVVRIQHDRGHHLIDTGPYARVRHPGYAAMIPSMPFSALALGSWASFAIALVFVALIVRRVVFEDAFLTANLAGYPEYTQRVRYRLIPGIW